MRILRTFLSLVVLALTLPSLAGVEVVAETKTFHIPGKGPRVEVNMAFLAGTVVFVPNERGYMQGRVEALTLIEQEGRIVTFAKSTVAGPERMDSLYIDMLHQELFDLAPGSYDLSIEVRDLNSTDTTVARYRAPLAVGALAEGVAFSDILFAERIDRAAEGATSMYGYVPVPLLSDYFPASMTELTFYAEVYGTDKAFGTDSLYMLTYQIEVFEKKTVYGQFKKVTRAKGRPVEPVIATFDISALPSGNYLLALEARDRRGDLMGRKELFFQRNNPVRLNYDLQAMDQLNVDNTFAGLITDRDSLAEYVNSLQPIADPLERKIITDRWNDRNADLMKRFFYSFWANRSNEPEKAWAAYRQEVIKVNKLFGCRVLKGYETDRGRVYLKYGPPNTMMDRFNDMGTTPYTIWHYYRAGKYTNRRFVFYQPDMVTNCFQLLHSEVPGEINNPQWNNMLHQRNTPMPGVQATQPGTLESDRVREFYNDPR